MRVIRKAFDIIRGAIKSFFLKLFHIRQAKIGKRLEASGGSSIRITNQATLRIGSRVGVGKNSVVSVLKKGQLDIGNNVKLGINNMVVCHESIKIGDDTIFAPNVLVYDHDHVFSRETGVDKKNFKTSPVEIGKNCWIGANTMILRGTKIGDNCVIGAGCVIKGEYPDGSVIVQKRVTDIK